MIRRLIELLLEIQPGLEAEMAIQIEKQLRAEFKGERVYVKEPKPSADDIIRRIDGRNIKEVSKDLGVSRETVYRAIRRRRELGSR